MTFASPTAIHFRSGQKGRRLRGDHLTFEEQLKQHQTAAKAVILAQCDRLATAGITFVVAHFDGSGDDGVTEDVKCYDSDVYTYEECEQVAHDASHLRYEVSPEEREQRRKLALAIRVQKESRSRILQVVPEKPPPALARADFEMVALDYFHRLGHDNHHRLFQIYGWEEKKTKTTWGGNSVDHEKLAGTRIHTMTAADLNRFIVAWALVPDLYCPGYSSAETLSKEANLIRTTARYKVDASKITGNVTAELSAKRKGGKLRTRNRNGSK